MRRLIASAAAFALATGAQAQEPALTPAAPAPPDATVSSVVVTARRPTHVSGVTVVATNWCPEPNAARYPADRAPRVVDSYPEPGGAVPPGYALVRVSFDAPMSCYSEVTVEGGGDDDPCEPAGTWELPDRRSWIMQCRLQAGAHYRLDFRRSQGQGFVGLSGRTAEPFSLDFTTSQGPPTPSVQAAQLADPGPPGAARTAAYVTCADTKDAAAASRCQHQSFRRPPG